MYRKVEYEHLADDMFRRASDENNAQLKAQWEILGARYLEISKQTPTINDDPLNDPVQMELLKP